MTYSRGDGGFGDESMLLERVRESSRSVAVYDVTEPALLALSESAREQLGFVDVDPAEVDIVDAASDPDSVRRLLALIRDGQLTEWKFRSWLRAPSGEGYWDYGTGQLIDVGSRRLGLVSYPSPSAGALTPTQPFFDAEVGHPVSRAGSNRVVELEEHLRRILREVDAAGLAGSVVPVESATVPPGFEELSPREREIVTRLLRGERVPTIARTLYLSASTVRNQLCGIYRKFGVHSQVELIEVLQHAPDRAD